MVRMQASAEYPAWSYMALDSRNIQNMVRLMDEGYGVKHGIPQLVLAGASVADVYVILLFSTFVGMMQGESASLLSFVNIPVSILLGMAVG